MIAAAALVWAKTNPNGNVYVVIPNDLLLERDLAIFEGLWELGRVSHRIIHTATLPMEAGAEDLLLVDEADQILFNEADSLLKLPDKLKILAFTATVSASDFESVEV